MAEPFPSLAFLAAVRERVDAEAAAFRKLGFADTTFGVRLLAEGAEPARLFVLTLDTYACASAREAAADGPPPDGVDFVLEAPYGVWREMLASLDRTGHVDARHTINTLTHHDRPMSVAWSDPVGHDKLFRYQESIQLLFDVAARLSARAAS